MENISTRKRIEEDLALLKSMIYRMNSLVAESLEKSVHVLKNRDVASAELLIEDGDAVDDLEDKIDTACMEFAARYQPLGEDLRTVVSFMHIAVDLERIGDYSESIAKVTISTAKMPQLKPLIDIPRMVKIITEMLRICMTSIDAHDGEAVKQVFPLDDDVDDLEQQIMRELMLLIMERPERIEHSFELMNVAKTLERAGDHVTNIAERIAYMCTGTPAKASDYRRRKKF